MMPASSHGPAPEQEPIIVEVDGLGEIEFDAGTSPDVIQAKVRELTGGGASMHPHAKVGQWVLDNAPMLGAGLGAIATGGASVPLQLVAAASGGVIGSRLRGDTPEQARTEGLKQGALEAGGLGAMRAVGGVAKRVYRAGMPKHILDKFRRADLPQQGLESRVLLGTKRGTEAASAAKASAGREAERMAHTAPDITPRDIEAGFRPKYNKALTGGKVDRANEISAHVKQASSEIGPKMSGPGQYARKEFLEQESKPAMQAANPNLSAVNPQLANIERKTIVKNLRKSEPMAKALNKSQATIGVERAAQATENSTLLNRLGHGGLWNAGRSPVVFSGAGIAMNEGKRALSPEAIRLLALVMGDQQ